MLTGSAPMREAPASRTQHPQKEPARLGALAGLNHSAGAFSLWTDGDSPLHSVSSGALIGADAVSHASHGLSRLRPVIFQPHGKELLDVVAERFIDGLERELTSVLPIIQSHTGVDRPITSSIEKQRRAKHCDKQQNTADQPTLQCHCRDFTAASASRSAAAPPE